MVTSATIVVTGAQGYIGSALVPKLSADGYSVRCVSRSLVPGQPQGSNKNVDTDLRRSEDWAGVLGDAAGVIHLASRTALRAAEADEAGDDEINVGPVRALVSALQVRPRGEARIPVVFASTATIFGDGPELPCDEKMPDRPLSVYDRHKLKCEGILKQATQDGYLAACSLRLANVYGRASATSSLAGSINNNRGILNNMMARAIRGEALTVYGAGNYIRDFIHLDDVVRAFAAALANTQVCDGTSYVIATGKGHSLTSAFSMVAGEAARITRKRVDVRHVPEPADLHQSERRNFIGNPDLFASRTGWAPEIDLATGIRRFLNGLTTPNLAVGNG